MGFSLYISVDSDDDLRALYQAVARARASEQSEMDRLRRLRASGYGAGSSDGLSSELGRAETRERMLDRALWEVASHMETRGLAPW